MKSIGNFLGNKMFIVNPYRYSAASSLLTGLVSWWSMDETSGTRADSHGTNDAAVFSTAIGYDTGIQSNAAVWNNSPNQFLRKATSTGDLWDNTNDWSFSIWAYFTGLSTWGLFHNGTSSPATSTNYTLTVQSSKFGWYVPSGGTFSNVTANTFGTLSINTWYHCYCYFEQSTNTMGISINNGATDTNTQAGPNNVANPNMDIVTYGIGTYRLAARLDEFGVWNRLLTTDERTELYSGIGYPG